MLLVEKPYQWVDGAKLDDHTKRKHKILAEYFHEYVTVRCQIPQQTKFRLAIVDGFAGAGRYECGARGSPLIFLEELIYAVQKINLGRVGQNLPQIDVECLLILNDADPEAVGLLKSHCEPVLAGITANHPRIHVSAHYLQDSFEASYPAIKERVRVGGFRNVLFNLDQCGHSQVALDTIIDIMTSTPSAEIFYTFMVTSLLAYLRKRSPDKLLRQLSPLGITDLKGLDPDALQNNQAWLGQAERIVFDTFSRCARYVSPFSINNPNGWRYWLIHFASNFRARQVYNDTLHANASSQAHFGRSGLNMLSYDPTHEGALYLFDLDGRAQGKASLLEDIPRLVAQAGDAMPVLDFYESAYNATPAHKDDIHAAIIENDDLEVITSAGGERRKAHTIRIDDTLRLKRQRTFFTLF